MRRIHFPGLAAGCLVMTAILLGGCGGGGGDGDGASAPVNPPTGSDNAAPTISGTPGSTVVAGQAFSFQPSARDADGDTLSFTISNLPGWAAFNPQTGRLSGTPNASQVGSYADIRITVSDGSANASLGPFTLTVADSANGSGSATLSWTPPTNNSNGSSLTNLAGFQVKYGRTSSNLDRTVSLDNPSINRYVVENLGSGTWYFAVVAVSSSGATSDLSNTANKTIS